MAGDVIVLTKPLGTQIAVNAHQWIDQVLLNKAVCVCVCFHFFVLVYRTAHLSCAIHFAALLLLLFW